MVTTTELHSTEYKDFSLKKKKTKPNDYNFGCGVTGVSRAINQSC